MKTVLHRILRTILTLWAVILLTWIAAHGTVGYAATTERGWKAPYLFRKANPCPSTGRTTGACPGWVMDHMVSLRCGGADVPENIWWQRVQEAKEKDSQEDECWRYYPGATGDKLRRT